MAKETIEVTRAFEFDDGNISINLEINGVTIYGASIVKGKKGRFVSFPSYKKDGRYWHYAYYPLDDDQTAEILDQAGGLLAGKTKKRR